MSTPEGRIKARLTRMLRNHGVWYFFPATFGMGRSGIPDVICLINGRFVGIECKADKTKKMTRLQQKAADEIVANGGKFFLVYDDLTISDVETWVVETRIDAAMEQRDAGS